MWGHPSFRGMFGRFPDLLGSGIAQSAVSPRRKNLAPCAGTANCVCKSQTTGLHALASTISRRTMISSGSDVCEIQTIAQTNVLCSSTKGQGRNNRGWSLVLGHRGNLCIHAPPGGYPQLLLIELWLPLLADLLKSRGFPSSLAFRLLAYRLLSCVCCVVCVLCVLCVCVRARARVCIWTAAVAARPSDLPVRCVTRPRIAASSCRTAGIASIGRELPLRVPMVANIAQITAHRCPVLRRCQCCNAEVREWGRAGPRRVRYISRTQ